MKGLFLLTLIASLLICCGIGRSFAVTDEDIKKFDPSSDEITGEVKDTYTDTLMDILTVKDEMGTNYSLKFAGSGTLMEFKIGDMVKVSIGNRHIESNGIFALERTVVQNGEFKVTIPVYLALSPQGARSIRGSIFGIGLVFYLY